MRMRRDELSILDSDRHDRSWKGVAGGFACRTCGAITPADDIQIVCKNPKCGKGTKQAAPSDIPTSLPVPEPPVTVLKRS
jgi:hypothetical protein